MRLFYFILFLFVAKICAQTIPKRQNLWNLKNLDYNEVFFDNLNISDLDLSNFRPEMFEFQGFIDTVTGANTESLTPGCAKQIKIIQNNKDIALIMLDASSKLPSGLLYSSPIDYGNFLECLSIDRVIDGVEILGKHCTQGIILPLGKTKFFGLSACIPNECTGQDMRKLLNVSENTLTKNLLPFTTCSTKYTDTDMNQTDIIVAVFFAIIGLFLVCSTTYDLILYYTNQKPYHELLTSFSILTNGRKLLHISNGNGNGEQVHVFNGLKFISMMWVVAGHGFALYNAAPVINFERVYSWNHEKYAQYITSAPLAVDTFFFISGFLLAYQYLKLSKDTGIQKQIVSVPLMYLHRYLRLTPAVLAIWLVMISPFKYLGSGPVYSMHTALTKPCTKYWWSYFLYIQNYYNWEELCLTQTWYLSADMQMFLITPFVIIPVALYVKKKYGAVMMGLTVLNIFVTFLPMVIKFADRTYVNPYDTISRLSDYFIGLQFGTYMRMKKDNPFIFSKKPIMNFLTWSIVLVGMFITTQQYHWMYLYGKFNESTVFYTLMRPAWSIGLGWIVYSCHKGYGGFVNWILCRPIFQIGSRLSYCIYIVHGSVIAFSMLASKTIGALNDWVVFYAFCGHFMVSIICAFILTLSFEAPFIIIEKHMFGRAAQKPKTEPTTKIKNEA